MRSFILSAATILSISLVSIAPAFAQSQRITCLRDRNIINCGNYGSFKYRSNNNNESASNNNFNEINDLYIHVLGRNATSNDLRNYNRAINNQGWSLVQARRNLANTQEFNQAINNLYREFLGRNADTNELQSYRNAVINGRSFEDIRNEIADISDFRNTNNNDNYNQSNNDSNFEDGIKNVLCQSTGLCF